MALWHMDNSSETTHKNEKNADEENGKNYSAHNSASEIFFGHNLVYRPDY